ncbi:hypothetical protein [Mycobacterium bourgelatii]|uniref:ATP-binding protein n=1 Tax=Mycobacterium bourgelatii TaxID=1273442 RepID=A0A7I9YQS8_MYCBU|nr:hypothetical protein [Mycobacterium bourgelatii]MCV6976899.1 hypothetical protein [Mycobacterium bourgelatii]GFG90932.1 hypothetical protein MBOU_29740 [Mycobacterium bourgelatii]
MVALGGGGIAAFGLRYQYLVTAEYVLAFLRKDLALIPHADLVIEPLHKKDDGKDDDVVDFAIEIDDEPSHNVQVKSSSEPEDHPLQPAAAREVFDRLVNHPAEQRILLTNKPLSPALADAAVAQTTYASRTQYAWPSGPQAPAGEAEPRIICDARSTAELFDSIAELVRGFRVERGRSPGAVTCQLLVSILVDYIFSAAAGTEPNRISALDLLDKLVMPDATIAQVAGGFDWGLPITNIPNYLSTVPRLSYLDVLQNQLHLTKNASAPSRVVLTGRTGNGKTVLASDYCHIEAITYAFICWIDCRDVDFIEPQIRNLVEQLNETVPTGAAVGPVFAGILGRQAGPWLLVFDGLQNRSDIEEYIPSRGYGSIIVTSNNSLNWWPSTPIIEVGELTEDEAIDCFATYADIASAELDATRDSIRDIVVRLGLVPLAVSMSAIYFRNTEGQLDELALQYFSDLDALADDASIPPGFPTTAFAAIQHASRSLAKGTRTGELYGLSARAVVEIGCLLAPELLPLNFILQATAESVQVNLANLPVPSEVDRTVRRGVLSALRTQSIAERVVNDGEGNRTPVSETVAVHPLVHEILRRSYLAAVPPGYLESQCTVFMYFLVGWLGQLRDQAEFFAVEQLRLHASALLTLIVENEPMSSLSTQNHRVYTYAKALLRGELSTCAASRGRLQEALELGHAATQDLAPWLHEQYARLIRAKILSNMIGDLSIGEAAPEAVATLVDPLLVAVREAEANADESKRRVGYTIAAETFSYLNRTDLHRNSPLLFDARTELADIANRDPSPNQGGAIQNNLTNRLYEAGQFDELLHYAVQWRDANSSVENGVLLDALVIICQLHTGAIDDALAAIDALVSTTVHANYLLLSLHEALKKVGRELHRVNPALPGDRDRLQPALERVLERYNELGGLAAGSTPPG